MNRAIPRCAIIIVTYNSEKHIHKAMKCINRQSVPPAYVIIVDSGSRDPSYLDYYRQQGNVKIIMAERECGFCKGNNTGMDHLPKDCDYVFFLNPDAFITENFLGKALAYMEKPANRQCGALTGIVEGYDIDADMPRGTYDTTGVFRTWYGRWYDRDQNQACQEKLYQKAEEVPAICGAVLFCRKKALDTVLIRGNEVFDSSFYMYKEDIDLSIRLRKKGWTLALVPQLLAYHCRGWQADRSKMPRKMRLASARNELTVQAKLKSPLPIAYSFCKYAAVKVLDM